MGIINEFQMILSYFECLSLHEPLWYHIIVQRKILEIRVVALYMAYGCSSETCTILSWKKIVFFLFYTYYLFVFVLLF